MISSSLRPVNVSCSHCGSENIIFIDPNDIILWQSGGLIQNCMPYLTAGERELLISRTCNECWKNMFGDDNDE